MARPRINRVRATPKIVTRSLPTPRPTLARQIKPSLLPSGGVVNNNLRPSAPLGNNTLPSLLPTQL